MLATLLILPTMLAPTPALQHTGAERALVEFSHEPPARLSDARILYAFETVPYLYVEATPAALRALAGHPDVLSVQPNLPIARDLATATIASRAREVWGGASDAEGAGAALLDGRGVGIAIVDDGFDATHPDLRFARHLLATPWGPRDVSDSAFASPHGTHVAGIAGGTGAASDGLHRGAAPGAALYGLATGPRSGIAEAAMMFDWILAHGAAQQPPIRVVSNSWHCIGCRDSAIEPLHVRLVRDMVASGLVVVFSAGNDGGNGLSVRTSLESTLQVPGVLGVANYEDFGLGVRTACVADSSSRGGASDPTTWPDLAAPGQNVMSAWATYPDATAREPTTGRNTYRELSGTSMAAPHVAGIVALLLQANPALAPEEVEYIIKSTAGKLSCGEDAYRADPMHAYDESNLAEGHGLVDAAEAVALALSWDGIPPPPEPEPLPETLLGDRAAVVPDLKLYLDARGGLASARPVAGPPQHLLLSPNEPVSFVSDALATPLNVSGVEVDLWLGTTMEYVYARIPSAELRVVAERLAADGTRTTLLDATSDTIALPPGAPSPREFVAPLAEPVALDVGDRVRLSVRTVAPPLAPNAPDGDAYGHAVLWLGDASTPSRVELGHKESPVLADTPEACQTRTQFNCARMDEDRPRGMLRCRSDYVYRLVWRGPGGSSATMSCSTSIASCDIPADVEWGTCTAVTRIASRLTWGTMVCTYHGPREAPTGDGWCERWTSAGVV